MGWRHKYKYVPYNQHDERYFGCRKIVRDEWDYIHKRRANQAAAELEESAGTEERLVSVVVPESDGRGGFWMNVIQIFTRVRRQKHSSAQTGTADESQGANQEPPPNLTGIALSGGGIRSASFCLGVLQALAYAGWLKKLDYISTVSGGGYIGGSLSWLLHRKWKGSKGEEIPYGLDRQTFPYGTYPMVGMEDRREEGKAAKWNVYKGRMLRHLRQHARYLTPGDGINIMSLLAVALRNTLFSLFVYGGLLVVLFALVGPYLFTPAENGWGYGWVKQHIAWLPADVNRVQAMAEMLVIGFLVLASFYVLLTFTLPKIVSTGYGLRYFYERWMGGLLALLLVVTVVGFVPDVYCWIDKAGRSIPDASTIAITGKDADLGEISFSGKFNRPEARLSLEETVTLTGKAGNLGEVRLTAHIKPPQNAETARKSKWSTSIFRDNLAALIGTLSTFLSAIASIWAFIQEGKPKKKIPTSVPVAVASVTLIFGLLLLAYYFAMLLRVETGFAIETAPWVNRSVSLFAVIENAGMLAGVSILFLAFLAFPNLNYLSIHRYYRDRLMETFTPDLPDAIHANGPVPGALKSADRTHLYQMLNEQGGTGALGPYHIINANIVLVSSDIPKFRGRGGDNFILTPKYCGSNATGWCETKNSPYDSMTLPTAIAISGAAVHSNTGSGGDGMTRAPWLSFLMGFLNIRLGYWSDNPTPNGKRLQRIARSLHRPIAELPEKDRQRWSHYALRLFGHGLKVLWRWPLNSVRMTLYRILSFPGDGKSSKPTAIYPGLMEIFLRKNLDENSRMIQLSDGGHFENLGLYELIRRRLKLIIVCDGTADPRYGFDDLANAMEKVRADFGAIIDFDCQNMESMTPKSVVETGAEPDKRVSYAERGYLIGNITYNDDGKGTLIYLTTTLFRDLSADIYGYRKAHEEFPDQATSDQFFDEKQFEAYRELGFQTAHKMMCDENVLTNDDVENTLGIPQIECPDEWRQPPQNE